jgi:signal transduction histidine kinase
VAVFRTLQEALADAAARSARHVRVDLDATDGTIVVRVEDNGRAVSMSSLPWDLVGMRERAHQLGGDFEVESPAEGGVKIRLRMPSQCASA